MIKDVNTILPWCLTALLLIYILFWNHHSRETNIAISELKKSKIELDSALNAIDMTITNLNQIKNSLQALKESSDSLNVSFTANFKKLGLETKALGQSIENYGNSIKLRLQDEIRSNKPIEILKYNNK